MNITLDGKLENGSTRVAALASSCSSVASLAAEKQIHTASSNRRHYSAIAGSHLVRLASFEAERKKLAFLDEKSESRSRGRGTADAAPVDQAALKRTVKGKPAQQEQVEEQITQGVGQQIQRLQLQRKSRLPLVLPGLLRQTTEADADGVPRPLRSVIE